MTERSIPQAECRSITIKYAIARFWKIIWRPYWIFIFIEWSNHNNNPANRFLGHKKPGYRAKNCVSSPNIWGAMTICMIFMSRGGHFGFKKMPMDKILHTLRKMFAGTYINSNQSSKKVCTPLPPVGSYEAYSSWLLSVSCGLTWSS